MKRLVIVCMTIFPLFHHNCACSQVNIENDLHALDSAVARSQDAYRQKQVEISILKKEQNTGLNIQEKLIRFRELYLAYQKYCPDSAQYYVARGMELARMHRLKDAELEFRIDDAMLKVLGGDFSLADRSIGSLGTIADMPESIRPKMAVLMIEHANRAHYVDAISQVDVQRRQTWNTYGQYLPNNSWQRLYYESITTYRNNIAKLECELRVTPQPSVKAAMLYAALGRLYWVRKDIDNHLHCMIMSAINDVRTSNRESGALLYLVNSPYLHLNTERALQYVMLCSDNAKTFNDKLRSLELAKAQTSIIRQYQKELCHKTYGLYIIIGLLLVALACIVLLLRKEWKRGKQKESLFQQIKQANSSLRTSIGKEKATRMELVRVNGLLKRELDYRNENFFNVYQLISGYIADVKEFKKKMYNLITAGRADVARRELNSNMQTDKHLKNFFAHFDKAFLLSHPDFVKRFNGLLREEARFFPDDENSLCPELRIYALVCLGITDSVSIAKFLHYSTQTVYNYRLKVRRASRMPEKDFAEAVAHLYDDIVTPVSVSE